MLPNKLKAKIEKRVEENSLRALIFPENKETMVDFSSNDYLGFSKNTTIFFRASEILKAHNLEQNGATGSRLLSGNHKIYKLAEDFLAKTHKVEAALIFNSGYDANVGFFSSVPQRGDVLIYDELIHASIRDGMRMSLAKSYKFKHNDLEDLEKKCLAERSRSPVEKEIYVVTESVFSMDGDSPQLQKMADLCEKYQAKFVVDEAHAVGVLGEKNLGLVQEIGLKDQVFARLVTYGKAMGCHGAAILGNTDLKIYLVNFARSFIYTTALPPHAVATILASYEQLVDKNFLTSAVEGAFDEFQNLRQNIKTFSDQLATCNLHPLFIKSDSAIQSAVISGNDRVKSLSGNLKSAGFEVKAILSPTVPKGQERLRFCLHAYNTNAEIIAVLNLLSESLK
ncbi:MAG TPA: pyridoxal phosphate-dependent aminotransferase family protein [Leeuwenhoekiella sp.]|nr:pyridoxal phosphate-dependent aminotransferase family protein [Leeuwenhoekiella sp.]